jgi:hypothetical protein
MKYLVSIDDHPLWLYAVDGRYIEPQLIDVCIPQTQAFKPLTKAPGNNFLTRQSIFSFRSTRQTSTRLHPARCRRRSQPKSLQQRNLPLLGRQKHQHPQSIHQLRRRAHIRERHIPRLHNRRSFPPCPSLPYLRPNLQTSFEPHGNSVAMDFK